MKETRPYYPDQRPPDAGSGTADFVQQYLALRAKEERLYTNAQVAELPEVPPSHVHYREWQTRKRSAQMLAAYLKKKGRPLTILEVGCGNGWLSAFLARQLQAEVTGTDINQPEIEQARQVFGAVPGICFLDIPVDSPELPLNSFDIILFAASVQYFVSLPEVIGLVQPLLVPGGEIHITDTHFYRLSEIPEARWRTRQYYTDMGYPELARHYHHHSLEDLAPFSCTVLFKPSWWQRIVLRNPHPFHWICCKPSETGAMPEPSGRDQSGAGETPGMASPQNDTVTSARKLIEGFRKGGPWFETTGIHHAVTLSAAPLSRLSSLRRRRCMTATTRSSAPVRAKISPEKDDCHLLGSMTCSMYSNSFHFRDAMHGVSTGPLNNLPSRCTTEILEQARQAHERAEAGLRLLKDDNKMVNNSNRSQGQFFGFKQLWFETITSLNNLFYHTLLNLSLTRDFRSFT